MKAPNTPDYTSPIVGYRVWAWGTNGLSSINGEAWLPGRTITAKCFNADHEPAADGCSCGIYAAKECEYLVSLGYQQRIGVQGEVYLWGKICEHEFGYRAKHAYPKSLAISEGRVRLGIDLPELETLVSYGVDIFFLPDKSCERMLVWSRETGFNPRVLDRIADKSQSKNQYQNQYKCLYGNKDCGENAVYCEPCNKRYEHFLWLLNDDR